MTMGGERVLYEGKPFPKIDLLIPRASILTNVELRFSGGETVSIDGSTGFEFLPFYWTSQK